MSTYVDTSALLAVLDQDDSNHAAAAKAWDDLIDKGRPLVTSNYVLVETIALLQRRFGAHAVSKFQMDIAPALIAEWIDEVVHQAGVSAMLASSKRGPSLVDCVSFEVMRRLNIRDAFAYDKHFADAGFDLL